MAAALSPHRGGRPRVHALGEAALLIEMGSRLDTALNSRVLALAAALSRRPGVLEAVPGLAGVTVHYDPDRVDAAALAAAVARLAARRPPAGPRGRLHRIPAVYDGPDLDEVGRRLGLPPERVVAVHSGAIYRVFMLGFAPGFAYLGPLPPELRLPRREVPRRSVPAGSVAIAGGHTAVYPFPTAGVWHLIGRTSLPLLMPEADPPALLRPGDRVRFTPVLAGPA
ncbi:MAG: 5-oxoprolinase subunit PxpB [Candidatus Dormibacterales bacterium]